MIVIHTCAILRRFFSFIFLQCVYAPAGRAATSGNRLERATADATEELRSQVSIENII